MITLLLYIFIKKHGQRAVADAVVKIRRLASRYLPIYWIGLLMSGVLIPRYAGAQNQQLHYKISQGGKEIGWLKIDKNMDGNKLILTLSSEIKTKLIVSIAVFTKESSSFENGQLMQSSVFRKTNGHTSIRKRTALHGDSYVVIKNGEQSTLPFSYIGHNLLNLYFQEPVGISKVYSDNHERFLPISKMDAGVYKVKFPDGNSNLFYYNAGACIQVKIFHSLYKASVTLLP